MNIETFLPLIGLILLVIVSLGVNLTSKRDHFLRVVSYFILAGGLILMAGYFIYFALAFLALTYHG